MRDLFKMSKQHGIGYELYYGDGLERIFKLLGDARVTKWILKTCDKELSKEESWNSIIKFLEKESTVLQLKLLLLGRSVPTHDNRKDQ